MLDFASSVGTTTADGNNQNNRAIVSTVVGGTIAVPPISVSRSNGNLILSWASDSSSLVLESASSIGSWTVDPHSPSVSGGTSTVTIPMTAGTKFYRLKRVP